MVLIWIAGYGACVVAVAALFLGLALSAERDTPDAVVNARTALNSALALVVAVAAFAVAGAIALVAR